MNAHVTQFIKQNLLCRQQKDLRSQKPCWNLSKNPLTPRLNKLEAGLGLRFWRSVEAVMQLAQGTLPAACGYAKRNAFSLSALLRSQHLFVDCRSRIGMTRPVNRIRPVHPDEILREDFLLPLKLSVNSLAIALGVPATRIHENQR